MNNKRIPKAGGLSGAAYLKKGGRFFQLALAGLLALCLCGCGEYEEYVMKRSDELHRESSFGVEPVKEKSDEIITIPDEKDIYVTVPAGTVNRDLRLSSVS